MLGTKYLLEYCLLYWSCPMPGVCCYTSSYLRLWTTGVLSLKHCHTGHRSSGETFQVFKEVPALFMTGKYKPSHKKLAISSPIITVRRCIYDHV